MRVIIDATSLCLRQYTKGGVQRYLRNLLLHLDRVEVRAEFLLWFSFFHPNNLSLFRRVCEEVAQTKLNCRIVSPRIPPQILNALHLPVEIFTGLADVMHTPIAFPPPLWRARSVLTIHDLAYLEHPECFIPRHVSIWKRKVTRATRRAVKIVTVSEYSRGAIIERLGIPPERVRAIYHGISPIFRRDGEGQEWGEVARRLGLERPYILFVGTIQPNKNLRRLLDAFVQLGRMGFPDHRLVLAGQRGWLSEPIHEHAARLGLGDRLIFTEYVQDPILVTLYRHADVFVLPSLCEGFGIPVIEAMACGVPVVASKTGALPEVVADAGVLVDPYSVKAIAEGLAEVLSNPQLRGQMVARGVRRAADFTWERTVRETVAVYREVAAGAGC